MNKSNEWKEDLDSENKNQSAQKDKTQDHTSEDMDFEVVSFSSSEGEIVKRSRSYEEAINLENSSDFCNGQLTKITTELNSSSLNSELQQHGENPGIQEMMNSMEIVEHPSGGSVEPFLPEEGENGSGKNEKVAKSQIKTLNIPKDCIGTGDNISTSEVNASQGNINESGDAPSGTRSSKSLSTKDMEKPPDTPGQNKGKEGEIQDTSSQNEFAEEIQDSGTLSTENTVYKPSWSQNKGPEQQVNEDSIKLDERKRKSPEKENVDQSKTQHLSKDPSKGGDTKGKDGVKFKAEVKEEDSVVKDKSKEGEVLDGKRQDEEEGEGDEEEQGENDGEQEEDSSSESDEGKTTGNEENDGVKKKKRQGTRKKKKQEYQRKKNQLPVKSTDNKTPVSKNADNDDEEDSMDKKEHEKEKKSEQNRKLRSQTSKENDAANVRSTKPEGNNETNNNGAYQPSSMKSSQPSTKNQPGKIVIPVQFEDKDEKVSC